MVKGYTSNQDLRIKKLRFKLLQKVVQYEKDTAESLEKFV